MLRRAPKGAVEDIGDALGDALDDLIEPLASPTTDVGPDSRAEPICRDEDAAPDCDQVREDCIESCSETALPSGDYGFRFWNCLNACMAAAGC